MRSASVPIFHCFGSVDTALIRNDLLDLDPVVRRRYCFGIPAFSITFCHLSMSDFSRAEISSGVLAFASAAELADYADANSPYGLRAGFITRGPAEPTTGLAFRKTLPQARHMA
jgi:hypothetical protein